MNESNVTRLTQLIIEAESRIDRPNSVQLAEYLSENGVICAPVKIGQVVYAGLSKVFTGEEDEVRSWVVRGIGIDEKGRYYATSEDGEDFVIGEDCCRLTKAEAEEDIKKFEAEYTKEDAKDE